MWILIMERPRRPQHPICNLPHSYNPRVTITQRHNSHVYKRIFTPPNLHPHIYNTPKWETPKFTNPNLQPHIYNPIFTTPYLQIPIYQPHIYNSPLPQSPYLLPHIYNPTFTPPYLQHPYIETSHIYNTPILNHPYLQHPYIKTSHTYKTLKQAEVQLCWAQSGLVWSSLI